MSEEPGEELAEKVAVFLEAWVHQVLYIRGIYHADLFARHKLYNTAVYKSRHPELNAYVGGLLASLRPGLAAGSVRKLALVVLSPSGQPVERFVAALQLPGPGEAPPPGEAIAGAGERELERGLKDCLLKLQFQDAGLRPLPPGCTFELVAYSADPDVAPQQWVEEAPQPGQHLELASPEIIPVKSAHLPGAGFSLQLHIEASR
mmetsp:Transcript_11489/g.29436  ORF Transcript_11489/g.29436 Transcript_11489/m.29436 type:complete len:204 (-) Transcript_11489:368-979(-)|eukprot:jgi/Tetstr1/430057/TSEL_019917.t1